MKLIFDFATICGVVGIFYFVLDVLNLWGGIG